MYTTIIETINVLTGEMKIGKKGQTLVSNGIGSCVVVAVFDPVNEQGAMAHIMLPGEAPLKPEISKFRYAHDAIHAMLEELSELGTDTSKLVVCLVGGANVLKRNNDQIGKDNIKSISMILNKLGLTTTASALDGLLRRTFRLSIDSGKFFYTEGDSKEMLLHDVNNKKDE